MRWFFRKLFGGTNQSEEAFTKFILPQVERAKEAGLSDGTIDSLVKIAIKHSDGVTVYPGMILRDLIDAELE